MIDDDSVDLTAHFAALQRDAITIHNHPGVATAPSPPDIFNAIRRNVRASIVVGTIPTSRGLRPVLYTVEPLVADWGLPNDDQRALLAELALAKYEAFVDDLRPILLRMVREPRLTGPLYNVHLFDRALMRLSRLIAFRYRKEFDK